MFKEEGDTSQVNQSHDQQVAKKDKSFMRMNLSFVRRPLGNKKIDQWMLTSLAIDAQKKVTAKDWQVSHKRVNTRPSCRMHFEEWIKSLTDRGVLTSGEKFHTKRTSLFDAMPACWVKLTPEQRHEVISIIKNVCECQEDLGLRPTWTKHVVVGLAQFVKLEDVHKLRACYLVAQKDPGVIVYDDKTRIEDVEEEAPQDGCPTCATKDQAVTKEAQEEASGSTARDFFH